MSTNPSPVLVVYVKSKQILKQGLLKGDHLEQWLDLSL